MNTFHITSPEIDPERIRRLMRRAELERAATIRAMVGKLFAWRAKEVDGHAADNGLRAAACH
jgi:hypothetical protein